MPLTSFEDARRMIEDTIPLASSPQTLSLTEAAGRVLAAPLIATRANPSFDNSAVDGYLLGSPSANEGDEFNVVGEVRAGGESQEAPTSGQALRIFTGAPVPPGGLCIVMQEDVSRTGDRIRLTDGVKKGAAIRRVGADFAAGTELCPSGVRIGPAEIALAAWNGVSELSVFALPRISTAVTGDELVPLGEPLGYGQIHDSNGPMLGALARICGGATRAAGAIGDRLESVEAGLAQMTIDCDLIVVSGGASVGDYDFVPAAIANLGEVFFHGVSIKPGKPTLFGRIGDAFVFALPGNPSSAYVCFQLFVRPAIRRMAGESSLQETWISARYGDDHEKAPRDEFVRVRLETREDETWAIPVFEQGSFGLRSLSAAGALARLRLSTTYRSGDAVQCMILP
ncbi:MAG TPA: molybdopterin molybdotransferase MoeA [Fimbriimonadaceae bacterium]|nr:molybdopterin molybdotransferase MoeA [Fimbriimonadaceae bacterium]